MGPVYRLATEQDIMREIIKSGPVQGEGRDDLNRPDQGEKSKKQVISNCAKLGKT